MIGSATFEENFSQRIETHILKGDLTKALSCVFAFAESSKEMIRLKISSYTKINPEAKIPSNDCEHINVSPEILRALLNSLIESKKDVYKLEAEFKIFPTS